MYHCITKCDGTTTINGAENLYLVMPRYNLLQYSSNYSETIGTLWFYSKDEATNLDADIANNNFKSFKYKAKLLGNTKSKPDPYIANRILKNAIIVVPLKYLSNFYRSLKMSLIHCKVVLKLKWTKYCVLSAPCIDNFYDQPIDFNIKQYEEIRKLITGQGEDYTTGWLIDFKYINNHYRLIAVDL